MDDVVIRVSNISKKYIISSAVRPDSLREKVAELAKLPQQIFSKVRVKQKNFWALKDVSFEVRKGEILGIIGRNGAGKSTLLKILSRVTEPDSGEITMKGKVASLLEVGTGFNPELTGRENIYLNGAIIGMTRREISQKFDDIVEFSGVREFLDVPVKRYSSGMYVRLAFAVASQLESDILLLDEVLSVGDISFQKKSMKKMNEMIHSGKTIIFVSHNLSAVSSICQRGIMMEKGKIVQYGDISETIKAYYEANSDNQSVKTTSRHEVFFKPRLGSPINFTSLSIVDHKGKIILGKIGENEPFAMRVTYKISKAINYPTHLTLTLENADGTNILYNRDIGRNNKSRIQRREKGNFEALIPMPENILGANTYYVTLSVYKTGGSSDRIDHRERVLAFEVVDKVNHIETASSSILSLDIPWKTSKIS